MKDCCPTTHTHICCFGHPIILFQNDNNMFSDPEKLGILSEICNRRHAWTLYFVAVKLLKFYSSY